MYNFKPLSFGELRKHKEKPETILTGDIVNYLEHKYNPTDQRRGEWAGFAEVSDATGWKRTGGIDFWAIHCWQGNTRFAYEIKVSRSDFKAEMKKPAKRRKALLISNHFWFITPEGLLKTEEIPPECGLKEVFWDNNQKEIDQRNKWREEYKFRNECSDEKAFERYPAIELEWFLNAKIVLDSPMRDSIPPSWTFVASLFRRMTEMERQRQREFVEAQQAKVQVN